MVLANKTRQPFFDQGQTERRREMGFSSARRSEAQEIGSLFEPGVAGGERLHLRLRDQRHGVEVERVEGLSRRQSRFLQMTFESPLASLHYLLFGEGGQEAGGGPALLVGCRRQGGPDQLDAGQSQFAEQQVDAGGVDLCQWVFEEFRVIVAKQTLSRELRTMAPGSSPGSRPVRAITPRLKGRSRNIKTYGPPRLQGIFRERR